MDIPAITKTHGFAGITAGCFKCTQKFGKEKNASVEPRSNTEHRDNGMQWLQCHTLAQRSQLTKTTGVRYTELIRLPYYDPVPFAVVDVLHNIYLGTAKRIIHGWIGKGIIDKAALKQIQNVIGDIATPPGIGRIPSKIDTGSGFSGSLSLSLYSVLFNRRLSYYDKY
jgi:hypothetical protein